MLTIIDGNNFFRRLVETGSDARSVLNNFYQPRNETIVVWDGDRGSKRRRAVYPQYKTNRTPLRADITMQFNMLVRVLAHCDVVQMMHPDYEGDDIIAELARSYAQQGRKVHIDSTDADFLQIVAEYPEQVTAKAVGKTTPALTKLYKIWVGDAADKITGIPKFGEKAWETTNIDDLQKLTTIALEQGELIDIGLPKAVKPTVELIRTLNEIISFYPVPIDEVMKTTVFGSPNYAAADAYLKEFFL